ncbi:MAG: hypothetical protein M1816_000828 [Peltula sp. TS41687]|nr:MAG: hypothetical protein M1816_000828 [Peltula sp. TS41687]
MKIASAILQNSLAVAQTTPPPTAKSTSGVSLTLFWGVAGALIFLVGLIVAGCLWLFGPRFELPRNPLLIYRDRRRWRAYRDWSERHATRDSDVPQEVVPAIPLEPPVSSASTRPSAVYSTPQQQPVSQQQEEPIAAPPPAVQANPDRSAQRDAALRQKIQRANLRRLNAIRENGLKRAVERGLRAAAPSEADKEGEVGQRANENPYVLDDTQSRSDDSAFDLIRRGPSVNPEFQARREERYHQKIAEGYTHEQAMSVSEASTDDSEDPGPFASRQPRNASLVQRAAQPRPQLAPSTVPERWQAVDPEEIILLPSTRYDPNESSRKETQAAVQESTGELTSLRLPVPNFSRPLAELGQARVAYTETTTDEVSTVISDDPWRDEVRENRRLGR